MMPQELIDKVIGAVKLFIDNDCDLLLLKVYEPAVSHRIAFYLEREYFRKGYQVDCEYDKYSDQEKPGPNGKPMRPDIVVHTRKSQSNNKIAIEVKKTHSNKRDIKKLKMLTKKGGLYEYGLGVSISFSNNEAKYKWFVDGEEISK